MKGVPFGQKPTALPWFGGRALLSILLAGGADPRCPGCPNPALMVLFKHASVCFNKEKIIVSQGENDAPLTL